MADFSVDLSDSGLDAARAAGPASRRLSRPRHRRRARGPARNALAGFRGGRVRAVVGCSIAETTLTFVKERLLADGMMGNPDDSSEPWEWFEKRQKFSSAGSRVSYEAMRIKKVRLRRNAYVIVSLHRGRVRWITITVRDNVACKKDFLYMVENLRKDLARHGYTLKYSGMAERQKRGAWHLHALAYLVEDHWDYSAIQKIAVRRGMNIDMRELRSKCDRVSKACAAYMLKLDAVVAAAYAAKMENPDEDYVYTLTSKGCDLPRRKVILDYREALGFIDCYGFRKMDFRHSGGAVFHYYLLESEAFGRDIYDSC
jgi:hypothetical protein